VGCDAHTRPNSAQQRPSASPPRNQRRKSAILRCPRAANVPHACSFAFQPLSPALPVQAEKAPLSSCRQRMRSPSSPLRVVAAVTLLLVSELAIANAARPVRGLEGARTSRKVFQDVKHSPLPCAPPLAPGGP
jgi:hypothetical protein